MNYAAVRSFPLFPSLTRGPSLSAAEAQAGASLGRLRRCLGPRLCARGPPFLGLARVWPSFVSYFALLYYFTELCCYSKICSS